jgi:hypothetical protein
MHGGEETVLLLPTAAAGVTVFLDAWLVVQQ